MKTGKLNLIGNYRRKAKKLFKRCPKNLFSCFKTGLVIIVLGLFVLGAGLGLKSLYGRDFSFLTARASDKLLSQNLFVQPAKNFLTDSPEMTFVQGNSMVGISPPALVTPQVLGGILGTVEQEESYERDSIIEYEVEKGDTISSVAEKFGVSSGTVLWANDLSESSLLKSGQKLIILPVSGILHLVGSGDTLGGLAKTYKADLNEIIAFNNLSGEGDIFIGDVLIIPGGKIPSRIPQIASIPLAESYFMLPVEGKISQGLHGAFRNAVDIANKCGKIVAAAAGGTVQRAGYTAIGGNRITILHPNGVATYYGHLSVITVVPGQKVATGEVIGYVGNTGFTLGTTGCHLHFEVQGANNFLSKYPVGTDLSWKK